MAEGGDFQSSSTAAGDNTLGSRNVSQHHRPSAEQPPLEQIESILKARANTPNPFSRHHSSLDLDDYFVRLLTLHSFSAGPSGTRSMLADLKSANMRSAAAFTGLAGMAN
jgi:hypothetical protein